MQFHHKKSEIQIGKESKGVSSDYSRNPYNIISSGQSHHYHHHNHNHHNQPQKQQQNSGTLLLQDEAFTTAHKRPLLQHPSAGAPAAKTSPKTYESSGLCKNKNPSSGLVRSPTIKTSIQSFDAATAAAILQHHHHHHHHHHGRWWFHAHMTRRLRVRRNLLAPAVVVIAVPCFWWYFRGLGQDSYEEEDVDAGLVGLWFDFFAAIVFFTGVVVCVRIAFPGFAGLLVSASLAALRDRRTRASKIVKVANVLRSPVTWTIGSKPKVEQSPKFSSQEGVRVFSNGDVYEGEFHKGKSSGSGVYYYCVSGRYEGDWVDGKYDGYGIETWAKGSRYRGQYRQGLRHGYGVYRFYTGDVYAGEWCNGQSHGYGVHTCEDGSRYVGEFKWGVKHGLGYYHFRNGDTYAGEYFADRMHGFGVYLFANGHVYEGAWHEGTKQGLGMYTFRNGESHCGHWNRGVLETPTTHNSQPGSPIAVNHSKVLNAVQEARHAAEKAYKIPRVDEKVNRAVAAANKSANAARIAAVKAVQKRMHGNLLHANV